jgi:hypothetical protein
MPTKINCLIILSMIRAIQVSAAKLVHNLSGMKMTFVQEDGVVQAKLNADYIYKRE